MKNINSTSIRLIENNKMNRTIKNKKLDLIGTISKTKLRKTRKQTQPKKSIIKEENKAQLDNNIHINKKELTEKINLNVPENKNYKNINTNQKPVLIPKRNSLIDNIKCDYILRFIFDILTEKKNLKIVRRNKSLQEKLNITINDYKKYKNRIEMILIPIPAEELKNEKNIFINYNEKEKEKEKKIFISYIF